MVWNDSIFCDVQETVNQQLDTKEIELDEVDAQSNKAKQTAEQQEYAR